jgi:hypothetical protein
MNADNNAQSAFSFTLSIDRNSSMVKTVQEAGESFTSHGVEITGNAADNHDGGDDESMISRCWTFLGAWFLGRSGSRE